MNHFFLDTTSARRTRRCGWKRRPRARNLKTSPPMNRLGIIVLLAILGLAAPLLLQAQTIETHLFPTNAPLPDGDADGFSDVRAINSAIVNITSLTVGLTNTGQFNGDLYAYLRHTSATATNFVVLLNRPGESSSNYFGYADSGFGVTFQDGAPNGDIHFYQTNTIPSPGSPLTGLWQPDERAIDPASPPADFDAAPRTPTLTSFNGVAASGQWTLFMADLESGAPAELTGWSLTIAGKALPTLSWATPSPITYGTALGSSQLSATATYNSTTVPGTFTYTPPGGTVLNAGAQTLSVTFTPNDPTSFLPVTTNVTLNVTPAPLTITASGVNKTYDGTATATVTLSDNRFSGDVFTDSYSSASFPSKNAGNGLSVNVSGISISGTAAANYTFNTTASATANITKQALTVTAAANSKAYDGTTGAAALPTITSGSVQTGDTASFTESYASKTVGAGKTLTPAGSVSDGNGGNNYTYSFVGSANGVITARPLTVTATGVNKPYDGTTTATVTLGDNRISGDVFTDSYSSASFSSKNAGSGLTVNVSGISISGTDAGNYTFNTTASATANIAARTLTYTPNPATMAYGSAVPVLSGSVNGFVGSDTQGNATTGTLTFTTTATSSSPVGSYDITGGGLTANNGNYTFVQARGYLTALTITQATPTGVFTSSPNPAGPGTNVTFTMTFSPVPSGVTPTGNVNFRTNGTIAGSGALSGGAATFATSALTHGWNTVVAEYAGGQDQNFFGFTNSPALEQVIDTPPVATNFTIQRNPAAGVQVSLATILAHCSAAAGDTITNTAVSSTSASNVTITVANGWVFYPPESFTTPDSFTFTVTDNYGLSATGTVTVATETVQGLTLTGTANNGSFTISGNGVPGYTYHVQFSLNFGPWQGAGSAIADNTGAFQYTYNSNGTQGVYQFRVYYYPNQ